MTRSSQQPLAQRLLMACMALLFLLQPIVSASGSCVLRARLFGRACCCAETAPRDSHGEATKSCCANRAQHDAPRQKPVPKRCDCKLSAPAPLVPPVDSPRLPSLSGEYARLALPIAALTTQLDLALVARTLDPPGARGKPGFTSAFHVHLAAGMARALSFERNLRC